MSKLLPLIKAIIGHDVDLRAVIVTCSPWILLCRYLVGGLLAQPLTWRGPFMVESGAMLPMLILCALLPDRLSSGRKPGTLRASILSQFLQGPCPYKARLADLHATCLAPDCPASWLQGELRSPSEVSTRLPSL